MIYFAVQRDPKNDRDIEYTIPSKVREVPPELLAYKREVEEVASVLRGKFPEDACATDPAVQAVFEKYMIRLVSNAQMGLTGHNPRPTVARDDLHVIQRELQREVDHSGKHAAKERLLRSIPSVLFVLTVGALLVAAYFGYLNVSGSTESNFLGSKVKTVNGSVAAIFFALVFGALGIWRYMATVEQL